jgi:hypothetical protein
MPNKSKQNQIEELEKYQSEILADLMVQFKIVEDVSVINKRIKNPFCSDRPSIAEAYEYMQKLMNASADPVGIMTAVGVVCNSIAKQIEFAISDTGYIHKEKN